MNNYNHVYRAASLNQGWIDYINNIYSENPGTKILVEVPNTLAIDKSILPSLDSHISIRIAGGFDNVRLNNYNDKPDYRNDCFDTVIYSRNEVINIMNEIERVEKGIDPSWSKLEVLIYLYDTLRSKIMYDPKYETKPSKDIRSLRGLISKQTVCAGYALILKEFLDRRGIECHYVRGNAHAWNVVKIDGHEYAVDLTWDNRNYRQGFHHVAQYLGQDVRTFNAEHKPDDREPFKDYQSRLETIDINKINNFINYLNISSNYKSTTYNFTRKNGTRFILSQVGYFVYGGKYYYNYIYREVSPDGKEGPLRFFCSEENVAKLVDDIRFHRKYSTSQYEAIINILFSNENILDSMNKNTLYLGNVDSRYGRVVQRPSDIVKKENLCATFSFPGKSLRRSSGQYIYLQKEPISGIDINGRRVFRYKIYEVVSGEMQANIIYSEGELLNDNRQRFIDVFLSRERLDRKVKEAGGYVGFFDKDGIKTYDPYLNNYFRNKANISIINNKIRESRNKKPEEVKKEEIKKEEPKKEEFRLPTFEELKSLASNYELESYLVEGKIDYRVVDIRTRKVVTNLELVERAMFANIWLSSAGVKKNITTNDRGMGYAFNEPARELYDKFCRIAYNDCMRNGVIDTLSMYKGIDGGYKYNSEIIFKLFRTSYQAEIINNMFLKATRKQKNNKKPVAFYTYEHLGRLIENQYKDNNEELIR